MVVVMRIGIALIECLGCNALIGNILITDVLYMLLKRKHKN